MSTSKRILIVSMGVVFCVGLGILLYPFINGLWVNFSIRHKAESFLAEAQSRPLQEDTTEHLSTVPEETFPQESTATDPTADDRQYMELWEDMIAYNTALYTDGQVSLTGAIAYERSSFKLAEYGFDTEVFGVLTIPKIDVNMPLYLGASKKNLAAGAAVLSETSIPIGGADSNAVIAGHRGWKGAAYLRYIDRLKLGDSVYITNLWETLEYQVVEIRIISPDASDNIMIQPGRDLVTLLTCHPYASGGKQRYLVICENTNTT